MKSAFGTPNAKSTFRLMSKFVFELAIFITWTEKRREDPRSSHAYKTCRKKSRKRRVIVGVEPAGVKKI
jgi:hypothetical protein